MDIASFNSATKDDLYLFITMAHPKVLQNENLRNVIFSRLSQIYEEEFANAGENANIIQQQQEIDREMLEYIYNSVSKAIQGSGFEVYYSESHTPDDSLGM